MVCRSVLRCVFSTEPYRALHQNHALFSLPSMTLGFSSQASFGYRNNGNIRARKFHFTRQTQLCCLRNDNQSSAEDEQEQGPPQEAVLKAISGFYFGFPFNCSSLGKTSRALT